MSLRSKCFREVFLVHSGRDITHYTVEPKLTKHNTKLRKSAYKSKWVRDLLLIFMPFKENSKIVYVEKQNPSKVHCKPIPVTKTGFSLWSFSHREKPVFITGVPAMRTGFPVMKTGFSLWEKFHRENPVFITGMGLQCGSQSQLCFQFRILNTD